MSARILVTSPMGQGSRGPPTVLARPPGSISTGREARNSRLEWAGVTSSNSKALRVSTQIAHTWTNDHNRALVFVRLISLPLCALAQPDREVVAVAAPGRAEA